MGISLKPPRPAAAALLLALPVLVLIVPQGTVERSLVPESAFVLLLWLTITLVVAYSGLRSPAYSIRSSYVNPLLLAVLVYFLLVNPVWSLLSGNDAGKVVMTAIPFALLGVYYLIAALGFDPARTRLLVAMLAVSGIVLAGVVVVNPLFSDLSRFAMRSGAIEGDRTLTLPLLPMAGVLTLVYALTASRGWRARMTAAAAVLMLVAILMTVTRAMLLAYLAGALVTLVLLWRRSPRPLRTVMRRRILLGVLASGALALPLVGQWMERIDPESVGDVGTILGRLDEYTAFYDAFISSPLLGRGMGYVATYPSDFDFTLRDLGITVCHSHLFFLAGTAGIVGMLLYYTLLGGALLRLWRSTRVATDVGNLAALAGMVGAGISGIVFTLTSTTFTTLSYNLFLAVLVYCAWTNWRAR